MCTNTFVDRPQMEHGSMQNLPLPKFRTKRAHKKSRMGCFTCRQRRVKCDEKRPRCDECQRRRLECVYDERPSPTPPPPHTIETARRIVGGSGATFAGPSSSLSPADSSSPSLSTSLSEAGVSDADLAKHYFAYTLDSFAQSLSRAEQLDIWRVFTPALAYDSPTVRHGMLALAAICLHYQTTYSSEQAAKYLSVAEAHGEIFVHDSQEELRELDAPNAEAVLVCSRLLCILGFAFFRHYRRIGLTLADSEAWNWLQLLRGVKIVFETVLESGHAINPAFTTDMISEKLPSAHPRHSRSPATAIGRRSSLMTFLHRSQHERTAALKTAVYENASPLGEQRTGDLLSAIAILDEATSHICMPKRRSLFRAICIWPSEAPKGFVDQLVQGLPLALAIYAHWLMLVVMVEDLWWVGDMGRAGIREVLDICSTAELDVHLLLQWPQRVLEYEECGDHRMHMGAI